ncbi:MAG TPA: response regulator [Verrucomicrobiota bacterium]|nr:response regulator [Verrucomicrobiota bacterium]
MDVRPPFVAVLDDEARLRQALVRLLRSHGVAAAPFAHGRELLKALEGEACACVLLDLHMPEVTGFNVLAALLERGSRVPVIVITGHDEPGTEERVRALGAADYLLKPLDAAELLTALRRVADPASRANPPCPSSAAPSALPTNPSRQP